MTENDNSEKPSMVGLFVEMIIVGISICLIYSLTATLGQYILDGKSYTMKISFIRSNAFLFIAGCIIHFLFEILKINKYYCDNYKNYFKIKG